MRAVVFAGVLLSVMFLVDAIFAAKFYREVMQEELKSSARQMLPPATVMTYQDAKENLHIVEDALNSRWMQWGAVGVMLGLFVWIMTIREPKQEARRDAAIRELQSTYLTSLAGRDEQYIQALNDFRRAIDTASERQHDSSMRISESLTQLCTLIRNPSKSS